MLNKLEIVIPTHLSKKGHQNRSWGPPTDGWIRKTVNSLYERCPDARNVYTTVSQNIHNTQSKLGDEYTEALRRFCDEFGFTLRLDLSPGFRGMRLGMCEWVRRDYLFLVEHDWKWCTNLDLVSLVQTFEEHDDINYIRFNKRANMVTMKLTATKRQGGDLYLIPHSESNVPLLATPQYSNNPHIERMSKYREWCKIVEASSVYVGDNAGAGGFEHPLQEASLDDIQKYGIAERNKRWGTFIYGKMGDPQATKHFGI